MIPLSSWNRKPMKLVKRYCVLAANNKRLACQQTFYQCEVSGEIKTTEEQDRENILRMEQMYKEIVQTKRQNS